MTQNSSASSDPDHARQVAISLMRMALALLDRADESLAAARLQHALDTLELRAPGPPTEVEIATLLNRSGG